MSHKLRNEVLRRWYGGQSGRDIARDLHISRKTVAKMHCRASAAAADGKVGTAGARRRAVEPWWTPMRPHCETFWRGIRT